jgi:ribosomal protein L37E
LFSGQKPPPQLGLYATFDIQADIKAIYALLKELDTDIKELEVQHKNFANYIHANMLVLNDSTARICPRCAEQRFKVQQRKCSGCGFEERIKITLLKHNRHGD